ncbi:reticulophagy regulator 3-like isoform X1 [Oculina patagonica]
MASDKLAGDSTENSAESEYADNQEYIERVKNFLRPVEKRWDYIQSVLLWENPSHSLCYFIALTVLVGLMASGKFRLVLLVVVIIASSLLMEDIRSKVWQFVQGGFEAVSDVDSRQTTLSFNRLCQRLALIWSTFAVWNEKLNKLKTDNTYKYYGVLFGLLLVAVFAYQYLPLLQIFYATVCALYFGPVIKHNGIHRTVNKAIEPFYRPFVVQWQHSRTKRQRDVLTKATEEGAPADSDDEFAKEIHPVTDDTPVNQDAIPLQEEEFSSSEPSSPVQSVEAKLLQGIISSAITQGLSSIATSQDSHETKGISGGETPEVESPSFDSSAVFLDDLQFSSLSQGGDTLEFEEGEFMAGLEFPDIDRDTESDSEAIHPIGKSRVDNKPTQPKQTGEAEDPKTKGDRQGSGTPESIMTSSGNTDVSDYEMLDQSEAEGMTPTDETDTVDSTRLGSMTNYVGKWLGY